MNENADEGEVNAALELLKRLRSIDQECGVRNSRIAFDVALVLFEHNPSEQLSVDQLSEATGYSGPTVRLILKRLNEFGTTAPGARVGKTQLYTLTSEGRQGFYRYIQALRAFQKGS